MTKYRFDGYSRPLYGNAAAERVLALLLLDEGDTLTDDQHRQCVALAGRLTPHAFLSGTATVVQHLLHDLAQIREQPRHEVLLDLLERLVSQRSTPQPPQPRS